MTGVFLSYRGVGGSYAPMFAHWVLKQRFGDGLVFEAWAENQPGTHFPSSIDHRLERSGLLVVFIDPAWLENMDLLRDPKDWVRKEILYFVQRDRRILPVLLDGAAMPHGGELPAELVPLTKWIGLQMSPRNVSKAMADLVARIEDEAPDLVLAALTEPTPGPSGPAALLRAERGVFPFRGRPELADLADWARNPNGAPVRIVVGPSGAGKTRLALRLCSELNGAAHPSVLVSKSAAPETLDRLSSASKPFLIIVDDAETRPGTVAAAVRAVVSTATPAKVLLLARTQAEWLDRLRDDPDDRVAMALEQLVTSALVPQVPQHGDFAVAYAELRDRLGLTGTTAPPSSLPATLLELQAVALAALLPDAAAQGNPWARIAALERDRWIRAAAAFGLSRLRPPNITEIVAAVTLFGAATDSAAIDLLGGLRAFSGTPSAEIDSGLALVRTMLPGPRPLNPLEPQPVADEFVAQLLRSTYHLGNAVAVVTDEQAWNALVVLGRCLFSHPDIAEAVGTLLGSDPARLLALAMTALSAVPEPNALVARMTATLPLVPPAGLERLTAALPQRSTTLADFAVDLTERALEVRRASGPDDEETGRLSRLLAIRLTAKGGPAQDAVTAAQDAVRWLDTSSIADRAESYAVLAVALDLEPECAPEAREAGAEAIRMYRDASVEERTQAGLAAALINQARRLPRDRDLAVAAYEILRPLHEARPQRYRSRYADSVDLLAVLDLSESLGREALRLRRSLAVARPDAYRAALAATLVNLGLILGEGEESRTLWQEAKTLFTALAANDPPRYGPHLEHVRSLLRGLHC